MSDFSSLLLAPPPPPPPVPKPTTTSTATQTSQKEAGTKRKICENCTKDIRQEKKKPKLADDSVMEPQPIDCLFGVGNIQILRDKNSNIYISLNGTIIT